MTRIASALPNVSAELSARLGRSLVLALVGASLVYVTGFAQPDLLHNAAHDSRHAFATPCH
jgi:cobalt transporter subunit CbtB